MVNGLAQGHAANPWQSRDLNPGGLRPEAMLLATMPVTMQGTVVSGEFYCPRCPGTL